MDGFSISAISNLNRVDIFHGVTSLKFHIYFLYPSSYLQSLTDIRHSKVKNDHQSVILILIQ